MQSVRFFNGIWLLISTRRLFGKIWIIYQSFRVVSLRIRTNVHFMMRICICAFLPVYIVVLRSFLFPCVVSFCLHGFIMFAHMRITIKHWPFQFFFSRRMQCALCVYCLSAIRQIFSQCRYIFVCECVFVCVWCIVFAFRSFCLDHLQREWEQGHIKVHLDMDTQKTFLCTISIFLYLSAFYIIIYIYKNGSFYICMSFMADVIHWEKFVMHGASQGS